MSEIENFADWERISSEINNSLLRSSKTLSTEANIEAKPTDRQVR